MKSDWEKLEIAERRSEIRISGKKVEGTSAQLGDSSPSPGWDQERRWDGRVLNVSAGGMELHLDSSFPHAVDAAVAAFVRFPGQEAWMRLPAVVRHRHHHEGGALVGVQFLWKSRAAADLDLEYEFCHQILLCERRKA